MIVSITLCGICLLLFTIKQHYSFLFINRTFVGALEVDKLFIISYSLSLEYTYQYGLTNLE